MIKLKSPALIFISALFVLLFVLEFFAVCHVNQGHFMFSLDDPYIHLALAENIWHGHYGVNLKEYSAPSSSVLWPWIIAPISALPSPAIGILCLNFLFSLACLWLLNSVLDEIAYFKQLALSEKTRFILLLLMLLVGNFIGLAFIGMEHNLQLLLSCLIVLGLLRRLNQKPVFFLCYAAIVLLPLVRFESASLSAAALLFLFLNRQVKLSLFLGLLICLCLALFSWFLLSLGLSYLPDSVLLKSHLADSGLSQLWHNFSANVLRLSPPMPKGLALFLLAGLFIYQAIKIPNRALKKWLVCMALAGLLHLLVGRTGWFWRYEIYLWLMYFITLLLLYIGSVAYVKRWILLLFIVLSSEHLAAALLTPKASNNIYLQQYQMHRLAVDFYKKPVAINDLGWVSYKNPYYVLDLWGLASSKARVLRQSQKDAQWMQDLAAEKGVQLIMIYHNDLWFSDVPKSWIKLAELDYQGFKLVSWFPVSIYTNCQSCVPELENLLDKFAKSLPKAAILNRVVKNND